jgi:transcriptional regulator with XRE-family HTH domain
VEKTLNIPKLKDALIKAGMSQANLAEKLGVSREAVSSWMSGDKFPTPDRLLRIGMLSGLGFDQLVNLPPSTDIPIVSFRKKANRKTKDEHLDNARETGELLKRMVEYLPRREITHPPTLKKPTSDYNYVQAVACQIRKEMDLEQKQVIDFGDLIGKFEHLHAILIPALWGEQQHHGNALNIHLPDSKTTWVFLNLDSNIVDFKFWMAHEMGHSLAPELSCETGENFADSFAQALLFPVAMAIKFYAELKTVKSVGAKITRVRDEAEKLVISPYTIFRALIEYAQAYNLPEPDLGPSFMGATINFSKKFPTVTTVLFKGAIPEPAAYIAVARSVFHSPFFEAMTEFSKQETGTEHFIHRVLGVSLPDAKALAAELQT